MEGTHSKNDEVFQLFVDWIHQNLKSNEDSILLTWTQLLTLRELNFAVIVDLGLNRKIKFAQNFQMQKTKVE